MRFTRTDVEGVTLVGLEPHLDARGSFTRTFCVEEFAEHGLDMRVAQCNVSTNPHRGTLRGLHYQTYPAAEPKLVRCTRGRIFDVAVDLRSDSPTVLRWFGSELDSEHGDAIYVPAGCAHGFLTLEDDAEITYAMGHAHVPELARGVRWDDPAFGIDWPFAPIVISDRDATYPDYQLD